MPEGLLDPLGGILGELQNDRIPACLRLAGNDSEAVFEAVLGIHPDVGELFTGELGIADSGKLECALLGLAGLGGIEIPGTITHEEEVRFHDAGALGILCRFVVDGNPEVFLDGLVQEVEELHVLLGDLGLSLEAEVDNPLPLFPVGRSGEDAEGPVERLDHALADPRVLVWLKALTEKMKGQKVAILDSDKGEVIELVAEAVTALLVIKFDRVGINHPPLFMCRLEVA